MKDILKPRGRLAHSTENRVGQAWRSGTVQVLGEDIFGNAKLFDLPAGHFQCRHCLNIVRVDDRGYAACVNCGMIYNDGMQLGKEISNREKKRRLEKLKYECRHNTG